jgi:hypothetical protein
MCDSPAARANVGLPTEALKGHEQALLRGYAASEGNLRMRSRAKVGGPEHRHLDQVELWLSRVKTLAEADTRVC